MLEKVSNLNITRLTPAIGAVVEGLQIGAALEESQIQAIDAALVRHHVLFFRDQVISPPQHRDFAARFGKLHLHPIYPNHADAPEIIVLDTDLVDLQDNALWHTDVTFSPTPPMGGVLVARVLPPTGGDTLWASSIAAFEALSAPMQAFLLQLTATHDISQSFPTERFALDDAGHARLENAKRNNPPVSHPVVRTHPVSKRKGLFVQGGFTTHINELSSAESKVLAGLSVSALRQTRIRGALELAPRRRGLLGQPGHAALRHGRLPPVAPGHEPRDHSRRQAGLTQACLSASSRLSRCVQYQSTNWIVPSSCTGE